MLIIPNVIDGAVDLLGPMECESTNTWHSENSSAGWWGNVVSNSACCQPWNKFEHTKHFAKVAIWRSYYEDAIIDAKFDAFGNGVS